MKFRSHGIASDLLVMRGLSEVDHRPNRIILRTPSEPNFWFGNAVIFFDPPVDPQAQIGQFRADFPDATHVMLLWDIPDMKQGPGHEELRRAGFTIDESDVLTLAGPITRNNPPPDVSLRRIDTDDEWRAVAKLQIEIGLEGGQDTAGYATFVKNRFTNRRRQVEDGFGAWFGAFDGDHLVADLGIFHDASTARYQSVETRASHRRRGICSALVSAAHDWAAARSPDLKFVIVADTDSAAGRIYRRCGFHLTETNLAAYNPSYDERTAAIA